MTSQSVGLAGTQAPRVLHRPPWTTEESAEEAIELAESVGLILDPWQQTIVRATLAERSDGKWAASEVGYLVARQNGKGGALEAIALHGLFLVGDRMTLWTAHEFKTCAEAYERMKGWVEASDDLSRHVVKMGGVGTGQFEIGLDSGARLRFLARSRKSGRGLSPQRVIFDEAQELTSLSVGAMTYATSAQANRQLIYTGTVPGPEDNAEHWTTVRSRGRKGESARLAWLEWTPKGSDDPGFSVDLDDRKNWAAANPALGYRIEPETIASEREASQADPEMFARERLSVWPSLEDGTGVLDVSAWATHNLPLSIPVAPIVLAVETTLDRSSSTIVAVSSDADERPQVKVLASRPGTSWVAQTVFDIAREHEDVMAVVVDGRAQATAFTEDIAARLESEYLDVELVVSSSSDMAEACAVTLDVLTSGEFRHAGDAVLDAAVRGAVTRDMGDGAWAWSRRKGGPVVAPLVAMTLALWQWRRMVAAPDAMSQIF